MDRSWRIKFRADVAPRPQPRHRAKIIWPKNLAVGFTKMFRNPQCRQWTTADVSAMLKRVLFSQSYPNLFLPGDADVHKFKQSIAGACRDVWPNPPIKTAVRCDLLLVFPRPKYATKKTRPNPRYLHVTKPDEDNVKKAIYDALSGIAWEDDKQVCQSWTEAVVAAGHEDPHVVVTITPARISWDGLTTPEE